MSKDWRRAVLAGFVALPFLAAAGTAGASDAPLAVTVGVGIDHTQHVRVEAVRGRIGAVDAIDTLNRPAPRPVPIPNPISTIAGLRGLVVQGAIDRAGLLLPSGSSDRQLTTYRSTSRAKPYVRFSEDEQVIGLSFKIQPPPQVPEVSSPGS